GLDCTYVRLSQWPLCEEERAHLVPDEFHHRVPPDAVPELVRSCDLLLAPSWPVEGFGLPALEAMASGVPAVVSDIPSFRGFASAAATLVEYDSARAFADAAYRLLRSPRRWRRQRRRGLKLAGAYAEKRAIARIEEALLWALEQRV
ncbi:MAG: glycosyltransferase, partial [Acidobacteriota bacterium]